MAHVTAALAVIAQVAALGASGPAAPSGPVAAPPAATASVAPAEYIGRALELDVPAPRVSSPEIQIDGRLDEALWDQAAVLSGFTQYDPVEGAPASENTTVRVLVSDEAVYFAVRADDVSGGVRATLSERDGFGRSDDYVRFILDTFNDQRRAYVFAVNPLGVQADGLWVEGRGGRGDPIDWNPDFLWESVGRVDDAGYTVEVKVPFKSVRFPELAVQDWGLQVVRAIQRTGFEQSWAPITRGQVNRLAQAGSLTGLQGLDPGLFMEFNPTLTGSWQGAYDSGAGSLVRQPGEQEFGFNMAYGLTSNLTLDATYNPDFSQVEADAGQIAVNERFALFFPEKRPFFLEGTDVFSMPRQLVYTRSIVNPIGAAKLSGKVGSFNVAYLGAVDDIGGGASNPRVNIVRVKRDVGRSSTVGAVYTDRTNPGAGFNRVMGADARLVLGGRYTLQMLAATSADAAAETAADWGSLLSASFSRASRNVSLSASFEDVASDFRAGSGFIRRTGVTQLEGRTGYTFRGKPGAFVERWGPSFNIEGTWDRDDFWGGRGPQEWDMSVNVSGSLRNNIGGFISYQMNSYDFGASSYGNFYAQAPGGDVVPLSDARDLFQGLHRVSLRSWVSTWERVRGSFGATWSETPLFSRGVPVDLGESVSADVGVTVYPTGSLQAEAGVRHVTIYRKRDGSKYSSATIPRLQARYQFTRALFVRGITEYGSQQRGDLLDPVTGSQVLYCSGESCAARTGSEVHDFRVEALVGYEPSPGTVVFVGYTREMRDVGAFRFQNITPRADGLFVKLSYRFRR